MSKPTKKAIRERLLAEGWTEWLDGGTTRNAKRRWKRPDGCIFDEDAAVAYLDRHRIKGMRRKVSPAPEESR